MVDKLTIKEIELGTFLKSAGRSFTDAQRTLIPKMEASVNMLLSNAELEVKVTVSSDAQGNMSIRPVSSEDINSGAIDAGMLSTLRMSFVSSIGEFKTESSSATTTEDTGKATTPVLTGLTLNEAKATLESGQWQFEAHAASREETAAVGEDKLGKVLRQEPSGGKSVDKTTTTVLFWVDLGHVPVKEIEGIGDKIQESLAKINVATVGELSLAKASLIAKTLRMSELRAQSLIDMAVLMSQLVISGFKEQVVELIVKGSGIRSIAQLADAQPEALFSACQKAVASGKVRVPRDFKYTADEAKAWIDTANRSI
jgi:hypothetical protein